MIPDFLVHAPELKPTRNASGVAVEGKGQIWGRDATIFEQFAQPVSREALITAVARSQGDVERISRLIAAWYQMGLLVTASGGPAVIVSSGSVRVGLNARCAQLFIVFSGRGDGLFFSPQRFRLFSGIADRNVLMLRDVTRQFYTVGISKDLRSIEAVSAWLKGFRAALPEVVEVHCLGSSMGAFAALLYGVLIGATSVVAFGPGRVEYNEVDLTVLLARSTGKTRCQLYFAEENPEDRKVAAALEKLPGMELFPQPGNDHRVLWTMDLAGSLSQVIPPFLGTGGPARAHQGAGASERDILTVIEHHLADRLGPALTWDPRLRLEHVLDSFETIVLLSKLQSVCGCDIQSYTARGQKLGSSIELARELAGSPAIAAAAGSRAT
jgi:hypothetical protein